MIGLNGFLTSVSTI